MRIQVLDIPEEPAEIAAWLEQRLLGINLGDLVAELLAVHGSRSTTVPAVRELLGDQLATVLAGGLGGLPPSILQQLLTHPRSLLELQDLVLLKGGDYWQQVVQASRDLDAPMARGQTRLQDFLAQQERDSRARREQQASQAKPASLRQASIAWYRRPWFVSLSSAAAVLMGVFLYNLFISPSPHRDTVQTAWGWNHPGVVSDDVPAAVYLNRLADGAQEWFEERPTESVALARRITEFRAACSMLIFAPHRSLAAKDRQWLIEKCQAWGKDLDRKLEALESEQKPLQIRDETDQMIEQIVQSLRKQARSVAAG